MSTPTPDLSIVPRLSVVIAAGGTGGHIYPGLALADALQRLAPGARISFVGTSRGLEGRLIPEAGYALHLVDMIPFARNVGARRYLLPAYAARAALQARAILRRERADVAVGMGGYASIPLIAGARLARLPSLIHESGAVAGRANRVAARLTRNVATAFDMQPRDFPAGVTTRTVGMPLGPELAGFDRDSLRAEARAAFGLTPDVAMLLVNGGSQGSARLNDAALGLARRWRDRDDVRIVLKAGRANVDDVERRLKELGGETVATCVAYLDRMDHAYAAADLALCRAGAGTIAELAMARLPAVLVPYPFAPDDHQAVNAGVLVRAGAALLVPDGDATADQLAPQLEELLAHRDRLAMMATAAGRVARPNAAEALAAWVLELAHPRPAGPGGQKQGARPLVTLEAGLTVKRTDTLRTAHERIRANRRGLVAVVGRGNSLLGTVTDGAIRRAVLAGASLDAGVEEAMSTRPLSASKRTTKQELLSLLRTHRVRSVPVVADGRLAGVRSLDDLGGTGARPPVAVVMVGGKGERLRPLTDKMPKPLLKIGGLSIVERLIEGMAAAGVRDVYLTLNYKADVFEERLGTGKHLGVSLHYVRERKAMGTAGALSLLPDDIAGPVVVANGDLVTTVDFRSLLDFHWHHEGAITVTGVEHRSPIPYGVLRFVEHHLLGIDEKPQRHDLVAAGIYVVEPPVLRFVPRDAASGMPDLIACAVAEGLPVHVFPILERWFDIGSPEDFERVLLQFAVGEEGE